ncbi:hypothetical protein [Burkholderia cepacia]|uniref:hypothetical protein n=1 Tax=Burkholderia cepacia TaxID=292 RepID=UPI001CF45C1E|nr:hypothetical protein [Burkholderia cepacia]MCA8115207.1 hypothetical protein [Burkholderia cepacia]MCA8401224.1 hypothetical protein [Burkholderia cepacia]
MWFVAATAKPPPISNAPIEIPKKFSTGAPTKKITSGVNFTRSSRTSTTRPKDGGGFVRPVSSNAMNAFSNDGWCESVSMRIQRPGTYNRFTALKVPRAAADSRDGQPLMKGPPVGTGRIFVAT